MKSLIQNIWVVWLIMTYFACLKCVNPRTAEVGTLTSGIIVIFLMWFTDGQPVSISEVGLNLALVFLLAFAMGHMVKRQNASQSRS